MFIHYAFIIGNFVLYQSFISFLPEDKCLVSADPLKDSVTSNQVKKSQWKKNISFLCDSNHIGSVLHGKTKGHVVNKRGFRSEAQSEEVCDICPHLELLAGLRLHRTDQVS